MRRHILHVHVDRLTVPRGFNREVFAQALSEALKETGIDHWKANSHSPMRRLATRAAGGGASDRSIAVAVANALSTMDAGARRG